jgi:hypothetical protein
MPVVFPAGVSLRVGNIAVPVGPDGVAMTLTERVPVKPFKLA